MKSWGSAAAVIAAVRDDAAMEGERLERAADAAMAGLGSAAVAAADGPDSTPRVASARQVAAELLADEDWQDTVEAAADRDAWIASVAAQGRRAFAAAPDALAWTAALAREAVRQLPGSASVVTVPAALSPAPDEVWRLALEASTGRQVTLEYGPFPAGCIARTPDARVTFDNRLEAREDRTRIRWRAALARMYETAVADAEVPEPA